MAYKPLTAEGIFECGLHELVAGKSYAYTPVMADGVWGLGVAIANEPGYHAVPRHWVWGDTREEMEREADRLNTGLDLDARAAAIIIATSIGAQLRRRARARTP